MFQRFIAHANGIMHLRVLATMYSSMLGRRVELIPSVSANQIGYAGLVVPALELPLVRVDDRLKDRVNDVCLKARLYS